MEVVRLAAIWDFQDPDAQLRDESRGDDATGTTSRIIAIGIEVTSRKCWRRRISR